MENNFSPFSQRSGSTKSHRDNMTPKLFNVQSALDISHNISHDIYLKLKFAKYLEIC